MSRYSNRLKGVNKNRMYEKTFESRQVDEVKQYRTPVFKYPTDEQLKRIDYIAHTWHYGDQFYKLADKHYGDPTLWWVIAQYNQKPTEGHMEIGEQIKIPFPLARVLKMMR
jgi:hypothetical protein